MHKVEKHLKDNTYAKVSVAFVKNKDNKCNVMLVFEYIRRYEYGGNIIEKRIPTLNNTNVVAMVDKADDCSEETKSKYYAMLQESKESLLYLYKNVINDDKSSLDLDKIIRLFLKKQQKNKQN